MKYVLVWLIIHPEGKLMTYTIKIEARLKTFDKKMTHSQMTKLINDALMNEEIIRDVLITDYEGNTINDRYPYDEIIRRVIEEAS
jgi:hypothetical protein